MSSGIIQQLSECASGIAITLMDGYFVSLSFRYIVCVCRKGGEDCESFICSRNVQACSLHGEELFLESVITIITIKPNLKYIHLNLKVI